MADLYGVAIAAALRGRPVRLPEPFNPDHLLWRAGEHGLHGLLAEGLEQRADLPAALKQLSCRLRALTRAQEALTRHFLGRAAEAADAFHRSGVRAVFVKGVALALEAYGSPGCRPFSDLDILVSPAELARAREVLRSLRYRPDLTVSPDAMETRFIRPYDQGPASSVDLHWSLSSPEGPQAAVRIPVGEILERARAVQGVLVPAVEDSVLVAAANLVRSRMDRLILVADFDRLALLGVDWKAVSDRAGRWGLRTAVWLGLTYAAELFGSAVPPEVTGGLRPAAWRRCFLARILSGSYLWRRRKFKRPIRSGLLPYVCLDTWSDMAAGLRAVRRRVLRGLLRPPRTSVG